MDAWANGDLAGHKHQAGEAALQLCSLPMSTLRPLWLMLLLPGQTALTSGWEFLGVDNFRSILLAGGLLDASADDGEGAPEKAPCDESGQYFFGLRACAELVIFQGRASVAEKGNGSHTHFPCWYTLSVRCEKRSRQFLTGGGRQSRTDRVSSRWLRLSRTPPRQPHREIKPYKVAL